MAVSAVTSPTARDPGTYDSIASVTLACDSIGIVTRNPLIAPSLSTDSRVRFCKAMDS